MPRLSIWWIRLSLLYLAVGFTLGGLLLAHKGVPFAPWLWSILPLHIEFLLFGWVVELIMGVAFWILPRFSRGPRRGNERLAWLAFVLVNAGIWLAGLGPFISGGAWIVLAGRFGQAVAVAAFAAHAWPRIKPSGA